MITDEPDERVPSVAEMLARAAEDPEESSRSPTIGSAVSAVLAGPKAKGEKGGLKGGAKHHKPTDEQRQLVEQMTAFGVRQDVICALLAGKHRRPLGLTTLQKHYKHELAVGLEKANATVAGWLFKAARDGNVGAQMFWLKCRARWKEEGAGIPLDANGQPLGMAPPTLIIQFPDHHADEIDVTPGTPGNPGNPGSLPA